MTGKRYKSVGANLKCSNGKEYMLVKRDDGFNVCQVCSKYTAKEIVDELNNIAEENEQLKEELKEFKDFVYSDEKILCYSCVNCLSKGIYEVECSEKGKVDVHGTCFAYWKKELEE